eukprot:6038114-Prymnesium_polylepis.1
MAPSPLSHQRGPRPHRGASCRRRSTGPRPPSAVPHMCSSAAARERQPDSRRSPAMTWPAGRPA